MLLRVQSAVLLRCRSDGAKTVRMTGETVALFLVMVVTVCRGEVSGVLMSGRNIVYGVFLYTLSRYI